MKALVYHGPGKKAWEEVARPEVAADTDAIIRVDTTTICGTDLHIILGNEIDGTQAEYRPRSVRRQLDPSGAGGCRRRGHVDAGRHPAHRL
jgi:alcohol dehydrogenase